MLSETQINELEKQQYRIVGHHSAVKVCHWTKKMIKKQGHCYKFTFYGIRSYQCLQMTTSMFCANRCSFCWRGEKAPVSREWYGPVDEPGFIIDESLKQHLSLLEGLNGSKYVNKNMKSVWTDVRHVALSLTGEPITYPKMNEILREFHKRKISTFLVTNAQYPEQIEHLDCITQLYISVDAPNKKLLKQIDRPLFADYHDRLLKSLDIMAKKKFRTTIRLTIIEGLNDTDADGYKDLIERGNPDFIEIKGYVHVGASMKFLQRKNMPQHDYVMEFSRKMEEILEDYEIADEHRASKVVLLIKKSAKPYRYIDFQTFFKLANSRGSASLEEYSSKKMMPN